MRAFQALETASQISDSAEPSFSRLGSLLSTIHTVHFLEEPFFVFTILLVLLLLCCTAWMFRLKRNLNKNESSYHRDLNSKNQQIQMLQHKISSLDDARSGYLNLITNMSFVMRNVNFRQKIDELAGTISSLVKSILHTDIVEFYTYDPEHELLKRIPTHGQASRAEVALPVGKGLVGTAAKDRMIITTEYFNRQHFVHDDPRRAGRRLWMAAPILFEKQILGAIAVGEPQCPNGTEKDLLSILAQIAGVVLYHQSFLIRARQNADTDVLTGLHNRRYFYRMSRRFVERATQEHTSIAILLIDLDHFKHYNDTNGHEEGDRLLVEFGGLLRGCTPEDAVVARYGGEEFIVMLPSVSAEEAFRYAEYLRNSVASHPFAQRQKQPLGFLSISGGIACFPNHGRSIQEVVRLADESLYKAKEAGRNRIMLYNSCLFVAEDNPPFPFDTVDDDMCAIDSKRRTV
jgi:diguanylate cyclase (GGDEF)-like protein